MDFFDAVPWYFLALGVVCFGACFAVGGFFIIRRFTNADSLRKDQAIASYSLNTIALLYCVIVGFVVIRVQERHGYIQEVIEKEANLLLNLYYSSCDVFSPDICLNIKQRVRLYAKDVVEKEWPLMKEGKDITQAFPQSVHLLWMTYDKISPQDNGQMARYQESLDRLNQLTEARFGRLSNTDRSEGAFMWTVLIYGGILVIFTSSLFASNNLGEHVLQLVFISSFIALVLLLIYSLDSPFVGPTAIDDKPFRNVLEIVGTRV